MHYNARTSSKDVLQKLRQFCSINTGTSGRIYRPKKGSTSGLLPGERYCTMAYITRQVQRFRDRDVLVPGGNRQWLLRRRPRVPMGRMCQASGEAVSVGTTQERSGPRLRVEVLFMTSDFFRCISSWSQPGTNSKLWRIVLSMDANHLDMGHHFLRRGTQRLLFSCCNVMWLDNWSRSHLAWSLIVRYSQETLFRLIWTICNAVRLFTHRGSVCRQ